MSKVENGLEELERDLDPGRETAVLSNYEPSRVYHKPECRNATGVEAPKDWLRGQGFSPADCCHSEGDR